MFPPQETSPLRFSSDYVFTNREEKARYVWEKYQEILRGSRILDVGADQNYLSQYLDPDAQYLGVGRGGPVDVKLDLEKGLTPFKDREFGVVMCLDVLEHLENLHFCFDECCRVTSKWLLISLPNSWAGFFQQLRLDAESRRKSFKYLGLPMEPPGDRHRWFFNAQEAEAFIRARGAKMGLEVVQIDHGAPPAQGGLRTRVKDGLIRLLLHPSLDMTQLEAYTVWAVLKRPSA